MLEQDENAKRTLIERYIEGAASESELMVFFDLMGRQEIDRLVSEYMDKEVEQMLARQRPAPVSPVRRYAAIAAVILITLSAGVFFLVRSDPDKQVIDRRPALSQGTLTLANGRKIILNKALNGKIADQNGMVISVDDQRQITFSGKVTDQNANLFNSVATARGEKLAYPVVLADGTKVWLNAASSITFPVAFNGKKRIVKLTGEAYFDVAHDESRQFEVETRDQIIKDIGTSFNINAYEDEPAMHTTLISGSASVNNIVIKPGQQAVGAGAQLKITDVNTDGVVAWKNNYFKLDNEELTAIMREISRWYNVEVVYADRIDNQKYYGTINRFSDLSKVLDKLESTGTVKFKAEGNKVTVYKK